MDDLTILLDNERLRVQLQKKERRIRLLVMLYIVTIVVLAVVFALHTITRPESLVIIDQSPDFVQTMDRDFDLSAAITQYDQVITALERYNTDHHAYPPNLAMLVPNYLRTTPGIYIRNGSRVTYTPDTLYRGVDAVPFTFLIYGNYPGFASMHGWELRYCPAEIAACNEEGDRHIRSIRLNYRWIWISSSAL